jgi:hypothetical protein
MLGFNTEAQGCLPFKITEEVQEGELLTVEWWDDARVDRSKSEEELRSFRRNGGAPFLRGQLVVQNHRGNLGKKMSTLSEYGWNTRSMTNKEGIDAGRLE